MIGETDVGQVSRGEGTREGQEEPLVLKRVDQEWTAEIWGWRAGHVNE